MASFLLIRHGAPVLGWARPYNLPPGPPLSDLGRRQVAELAGWVAARRPTAIVSSPFARARETAGVLASRVGCAVDEVAGLAEGGPGETVEAIRERVVAAFRGLTAPPGGVMAVVSHGTPIRLILESLGRTQETLPVFDYGNPLPPAAVWEARREADDRWALELVFEPAEKLVEVGTSCTGHAFGAKVE